MSTLSFMESGFNNAKKFFPKLRRLENHKHLRGATAIDEETGETCLLLTDSKMDDRVCMVTAKLSKESKMINGVRVVEEVWKIPPISAKVLIWSGRDKIVRIPVDITQKLMEGSTQRRINEVTQAHFFYIEEIRKMAKDDPRIIVIDHNLGL